MAIEPGPQFSGGNPFLRGSNPRPPRQPGAGRPGPDMDEEIAKIKERGLSPEDEKRELYNAHLVKYKNQANRTEQHRRQAKDGN